MYAIYTLWLNLKNEKNWNILYCIYDIYFWRYDKGKIILYDVFVISILILYQIK